MEVAVIVLSIVIGIMVGFQLCVNAVNMFGKKEKIARAKAFGAFLFCSLIVAYTIIVMVYLSLPFR